MRLNLLLTITISFFILNCVSKDIRYVGISTVNFFSIFEDDVIIYSYQFSENPPSEVGADWWTGISKKEIFGFRFDFDRTNYILTFDPEIIEESDGKNINAGELPISGFNINLTEEGYSDVLSAKYHLAETEIRNDKFPESIEIKFYDSNTGINRNIIVSQLSGVIQFTEEITDYFPDFVNCGENTSEKGKKQKGILTIKGISELGNNISVEMEIYWVDFRYITQSFCT